MSFCPTCEETFVQRRSDQEYCSRECKEKAHKQRAQVNSTAICPKCQKSFAQQRSDQEYCSRDCKEAAHKNRKQEELHYAVCSYCHQIFEQNRSDQEYCSRRCKELAKDKRNPKNNMTKPFVAWDGEGENGRYTLLANSDGTYISDREKGLSTARCLDFLVRNGKKGVNVWFAFGYDVSMILKDIPMHDYNGGPSLEKLHKFGHIKWRGFKILYYPKKKFIVSRGNEHFTSYDTYSFFQRKFTEVCKEWTGDIPDVIVQGKQGREDFSSWSMNTIIEYNKLECERLVQIMSKFREALHSANLHLSSWHGPGALATAWLTDHDIAAHIALPPFVMHDAVMRAFFGGRIEIAGWGHADSIFHYDINSAYPRALCDVLSLRNIEWRLTPGEPEEDFTLCHVEWDVKDLWQNKPYSWGPLPYRLRDGAILYPPAGAGWYWGIEARAAMRRFPGQVRIVEHWRAVGERVYPFREAVQEAAAQRLEWKAAKFAGHIPLKLVLNSLYGKLAQKRGYIRNGEYHKPPFQCHIWAGYVTAYTRAMIADALREADNRAVCIMTDSIWSLQELPGLKIGSGLGEWSFEEEDKSADFCGAGLYQSYDAEGNVRPKEYKSRGFSMDQGDKLDYSQIIREWQNSLDDGSWGGRTFKIRRFIGIGQAVRQAQFRPYFGQFIELERSLGNLAMEGQVKRLGAIVRGNVKQDGIYWMPPCPVPATRKDGLGQQSMFDVDTFPMMSAPYGPNRMEETAGPEALEVLAAMEDEE